jgi:hypothetical protein
MTNNPSLIDDLDGIINDFIEWSRTIKEQNDLCYSSNDIMPFDGISYISHDLPWVIFYNQKGTTREKFSLSDGSKLHNEALRPFAKVFEEIGFKVFIATYTYNYTNESCHYKFVKLSDYQGNIPTILHGRDNVHICISV